MLPRGGAVHGVAWWFDVEFDVRRSNGEPGPHRRFLTTAPGAPTTHWFQIRAPIRDERGVLERIEKNTRSRRKNDDGRRVRPVVRGDLEAGGFKGFKTRREPDVALGSWNLKDPYYLSCTGRSRGTRRRRPSAGTGTSRRDTRVGSMELP